jgi:hypothetical protein
MKGIDPPIENRNEHIQLIKLCIQNPFEHFSSLLEKGPVNETSKDGRASKGPLKLLPQAFGDLNERY